MAKDFLADFSRQFKRFFTQMPHMFTTYFKEISHLFKQKFKKQSKKQIIKNIFYFALEMAFWGFVFFMLFISAFASGQWMSYDSTHDHHLAFFTFLSGMVANGHLSGIDFYSPHSIFIPIVVGIFLKIFGISQIILAVGVSCVGIFVAFIFIYKTARLVLPNLWAKFAILTMLISFQGNDMPWFNHIFMVFVAGGIYLLCAYIKDKKSWRLVALGFVCFCFPYLRQQGLVFLATFFMMPILLRYTNAISQKSYKDILRITLMSFLSCNVAFLLFVLVRNGFEGLEILYSSLMPLVAMAQPLQGYPTDFEFMMSRILNYTVSDHTWHGRIMQYLIYWLIVLIPCIYYAFRPIVLYFSRQAILNEDSIKCIAALATLSTIVFNYPIQEDMRLKVQCMVGIWLFIDALYLTCYNKKAKIASILLIAVIFLAIHNLKLRQYEVAFKWNYYNIFLRTKQNHIKMPKNTPYAYLILKNDYANDKLDSLEKLREYERMHPEKQIIFDGELETITADMQLLFSKNNVALAHKFPYYYQLYDRENFMPDINERFRAFVDKHKPIILGCKEYVTTHDKVLDITDKVSGYEVLKRLGSGDCAIFVPKDDANQTNEKSKVAKKSKGSKK